ncbi:hypothetical protein RDI58_007983 [Solanum bulbocastanum]|uniref:Uncharacterized protein n=1 Tax=Solanum bulbocastanum TaxID=147425 RepID=A0AAN8YJ53_SOLBU
MNRPRGSNVEK